MPAKILRVDYFYVTVQDRPGEAYRLLSKLAAAEVDLLAFSTVPIGPENTQLVLFPANTEKLAFAAEREHLVLAGPQRAFLIQGDDRLGAFAELHHKLADSNVNVYAATGVTDGRGGYGYVLYIRPEEFESAAHVLGV
jgi:predicted amino acid-binding ACT domain protein